MNSFFQWQFVSVNFTFFSEAFFLLATVTMITKKVLLTRFHGKHCIRQKFLHQDHAGYQCKLSIKN